jgi:hypothetical protein
MSNVSPASQTELKQYCLRKLGAPVVDINIAEEQQNDLVAESVQMFQEYHFDGTERAFLVEQVAPSTLTFASSATGTFQADETITGGSSNATAILHERTSATELKFHTHKDGNGIRAANTTANTFVSGETVTGGTSGATGTVHGTQSTAVVFGNIDTKALTVDDTIIGVQDVLPVSKGLSSNDMFSFEYQFRLNELPNLLKDGGGLSNYVQGRQNLALLTQVFSGAESRQIRFNRLTDKLYIDMDWDTAVEIGDAVVVMVMKKIDGSTYTEMYNDIFLKKYTTSLFKKQWGQNLMKYDGVQLPGGVTLNGRQMYDDGAAELEKLEEELSLKYELPLNFYVG